MKNAPPRPSRDRDAGLTFVELVVTMTVVGFVAAVIAAAITVIFRTNGSVITATAESHDVQQAVNYFHHDIQAGPAAAAKYRTGGAAGSGCSTVGSDNVFRYDVDDVLRYDDDLGRRVAYRLVPTADGSRLDRYLCEQPFGSSTWNEVEVLNIADELPGGAGAVAISIVTSGALVDRVDMTFDQAITDRTVSATPRPDDTLPGVAERCSGDPLGPTLGFQTFVEGDVRLEGGELEGSLALGGALSWGNDVIVPIASSNTNGSPFNNVALYAKTVDWSQTPPAGPPGVLTTQSGSSKIVALGPNTAGTSPDWFVVPGGPGNPALNPDRVYRENPSPAFDQHRIETNGSVVSVASASLPPLDFGVQFDLLRDCSDALAALPRGAVAEHVELLAPGNPDTPYSGSGDVKLQFRDDANGDQATAVFNVPESELADIGVITLDNGSSLNASRPLIMNVSDDTDGAGGPADGDVTLDFTSPTWANVGDAKFVIYNFPNTTGTLIIEQDTYGVVYAPYAQEVITKGLVRAQIVAKKWTHAPPLTPGAGLVESGSEHAFNGTITWT